MATFAVKRTSKQHARRAVCLLLTHQMTPFQYTTPWIGAEQFTIRGSICTRCAGTRNLSMTTTRMGEA